MNSPPVRPNPENYPGMRKGPRSQPGIRPQQHRARETGLQYVQMGSRYRYKVSWFMEWMDADTKRYQDEVLPALRKQASVARAAKRAAAKKRREPAA